jgi:antirestriction protein ArdC
MSNVQESITASIVAAIEKGAGEFIMPWHRKGISTGMPHNPISKTTYSGANVLALWMGQELNGYSTNQWATYKQWQAKGAQVRKGEKSTLGVYWNSTDKKVQGDDGEENVKRTMFASAFYLFNADQVDGYQAESVSVTPDLTERLANAEMAIANTGAIIRHGGARAYYDRMADSVTMPDRWRFMNSETGTATQAYYSTLLHELTHWTGAKARLDRTKGKRFGDECYAFEELVAELGAAFLCAHLGIENEPRLDHAQYIENWLQVLKNDKQAIFSAASLANKAMQYIITSDAATVAIAA